MSIGYACMVVGETDTKISGCVLRTATNEKLIETSIKNLIALERIIDYNIAHNIKLFRISSDIIPFASHPVNHLDWAADFNEYFDRISHKILDSSMRVSMHPGQYTVLNSPDTTVVTNAIKDLAYHAEFMDALSLSGNHKIILHIGGIYGEKENAIDRFLTNYHGLPQAVRNRLVIENDDRSYNIEDVLMISQKADIPVVFDNLHHRVNSPGTIKSDAEWISLCCKTWGPNDGPPKMHYSQSKSQSEQRSHSDTISCKEFLTYFNAVINQNSSVNSVDINSNQCIKTGFQSLNLLDRSDFIDIMLEVKDKNLSALKCIHLTDANLSLTNIEEEWARYKYYVMSKSAAIYSQVSKIMNEHNLMINKYSKITFNDSKLIHQCNANINEHNRETALKFYEFVEKAQNLPEDRGAQINAAQHVWGYMKKTCTPKDKAHFETLLSDYDSGKKSIDAVKSFLFRETNKQDIYYLQKSHYFYI